MSATEHEVDRMVVRLMGDQTSYQKMLKDVESKSTETANFVQRQANRISEAFSSAFKGAQGMLSSAGGGARTGGLALGGLGAAVTAPMTKAGLDFAKFGSSLNDLNRELSLSAKSASTFAVMSERTGVAVKELKEHVKDTSEEFEKWHKEAKKLGLVLSEEDVEAATKLTESVTRVKQVFKGMWTQIGAAAAPLLKEWNDIIVGAMTRVVKWASENKKLLATIFDIASKLTVVGTILVGIGTTLGTVSTFLGPIVAAVTAGAAAWAAWDTASGKATRGAATDVWKKYEADIKAAYEATVKWGKDLVAYFDEVMTGIYNAIKTGDIEGAVEIAWTGAKVLWTNTLNELDKITKEKFSAIFQNLAAGNWKNALEASINEIKILWDKMWLFVDPILTDIQNRADAVWTQIVNSLDAASVEIQNTWGQVRAWFEDVAQSVIVKWTFVKTFFSGLTGFIGGLWESTFGNVIKGLGVLVSAAGTLMSGLMNTILTAISAFGGLVAQALLVPVRLALKAVSAASSAAGEAAELQVGIATKALQSSGGLAGAALQGYNLMAEAETGAGADTQVTTAQDVERRRAEGRNIDLGKRTTKRTTEQEAAKHEREQQGFVKELELKGQILELEARRAELAAKGNKDAAEKLETEKKLLETKLAERQAEADKQAEEQATADVSRRAAEAAHEAAEKTKKLEEERNRIIEHYDPVAKYMKQLKELNRLFEDGKKSPEVYKKALKDIKEELVNATFKVDVKFGTTGMDAVRRGTREAQELAENTLAALGKEKAEKEALAEVDKRRNQEKQKEFFKDKTLDDVISSIQKTIDEAPAFPGEQPGKAPVKEEVAQVAPEIDAKAKEVEKAKPSIDPMDPMLPGEGGMRGYVDPETGQTILTGSPGINNAPAPVPEQQMPSDRDNKLTSNDTMSTMLERIAIATEKQAEKKTMELEPIELA